MIQYTKFFRTSSVPLMLVLGFSLTSLLYAPPLSYVVTTNADSGAGSLRDGINATNANVGFTNTITFSAPFQIFPLSDLPTITNPLIIDGYAGSPGGATPNTNPITASNNAVIAVELRGPGAGYLLVNPTINGLVLGAGSDGSTIRGLAIDNFAQAYVVSQNIVSGGAGILVQSSNNTIEGNFIGADTTGINSFPNFTAIQIDPGADGNLVGGPTNAARNLISGHYQEYTNNNGALIVQGDTTTIQGNTVGLNRAGTNFLMIDATVGISTYGDTKTQIMGNAIAGHRFTNIRMQQANNGLIETNFIGTNVAGTAALTNNGIGIYIYNSPVNGPVNMIVNNNLVSGNTDGIRIGENDFGFLPIIGAQITNNRIGTNAAGTSALSNSLDGLRIKFAEGTYVAGNIISANGNNGITIGKAKDSNVKNNLIGVAANGTTSLPNLGNGIQLGTLVGVGVPAFDDVIGGAKPNEGNIISNNGENGITLVSYTQQETIIGNTITNNNLNGILVNPLGGTNWIGGFRTAGNELIIGGVANELGTNLGPLGTSNIISNNALDGIKVVNSNANTIQANIITNNPENGIELIDSSFTLVGAKFGGSTVTDSVFLPIAAPLGNIINNNGEFGVVVDQKTGTATDNSILSNGIVDNARKGIALVTG